MASETLQVYHVTTVERAEQCLIDGIVPGKTSMATEVSRQMDVDYDSRRPQHILELGVSRREAVYAHVDAVRAVDRKNGGWLNRAKVGVAVLSITVDSPENAFVCDGLLNVEPYTAEEYWASFTTLGNFLKQEEPTFMGPDLYSNNRPKRFVYMWPEVLLPGVVPPQNVSLHSSQA